MTIEFGDGGFTTDSFEDGHIEMMTSEEYRDFWKYRTLVSLYCSPLAFGDSDIGYWIDDEGWINRYESGDSTRLFQIKEFSNNE